MDLLGAAFVSLKPQSFKREDLWEKKECFLTIVLHKHGDSCQGDKGFFRNKSVEDDNYKGVKKGG